MKKILIRSMMLASCLLLTVVLSLLWKLSSSGWTAAGFLLLAEVLLFLPPTDWKNRAFPLRLVLLVFVYPLYLIVTLLLLICSSLMAWEVLLTAELVLAFLLVLCICLCCLVKDPGGEEK